MTLCGGNVGADSNSKTNYRVQFDYKDTSGVIGPDTVPNDACLKTSDDTIKIAQ